MIKELHTLLYIKEFNTCSKVILSVKRYLLKEVISKKIPHVAGVDRVVGEFLSPLVLSPTQPFGAQT